MYRVFIDKDGIHADHAGYFTVCAFFVSDKEGAKPIEQSFCTSPTDPGGAAQCVLGEIERYCDSLNAAERMLAIADESSQVLPPTDEDAQRLRHGAPIEAFSEFMD